jgi:DNA-binding protein Fis
MTGEIDSNEVREMFYNRVLNLSHIEVKGDKVIMSLNSYKPGEDGKQVSQVYTFNIHEFKTALMQIITKEV